MTYHFTVPRLPSAALSPNARGHWSKRAKAMSTDRMDAHAYFLQSYTRPDKPLESARIKVRVYFVNKRPRDPDNFGARLKGFFDGLTLAGVIRDDSFECIGHPQYEFLVDPSKGPAVEFEITGYVP